MPSPLLVELFALALGLVIGSYLNVVIHRLPRGASTLRPRSACPWCGAPVRARDNVPILSFFLLGGRCRACDAPISWRYPTVEAVTGLLFLLCAWRFGATPAAVTAALFCALMVVLAAIDLDHMMLPDRITLPGVLAGWALQRWIPAATLLEAVVGALVGAGILILVVNLWYWLRAEEGMGLGDVNMLAMIGAFLGWQGALVTLFLAAATGAATGVAMLAAGRLGMRSRLPFGLFLAVGAVASLFFGDALVELWLGLA